MSVVEDQLPGSTGSGPPDDRVSPLITAQLRLAISMRGGVSLAVWIGGALAEIDVLRRAQLGAPPDGTNDPNAAVYRHLLRLAGYGSVQVDVMSGASAGGLNGAIYAASLMYGFDFRHMLPIWVRLADLESMTRTSAVESDDTGTPRPVDSVLLGDGYFLARLEEELGHLASNGRTDQRPGYLDLVLTGTLISPAAEVVVGAPGENLQVERRAAFFQFHHEEATAADDHPRSHFGPAATTVPKLALAGRASSSFPFAFEPAAVPTDGDGSMATIFSERGDPNAFRVMDGGVLDNIPIARAIEAVAASPADEPTDRWLLYLYPSPADEPPAPPRPATAPARAVSTVRRAFGAKLSTESLLDDTSALDRHNDEARHQAIRWRGLWHSAGPNPDRWPVWLQGLSDMEPVIANRVDLDAARMLEFLDQPRRCYAGRPEFIVDPGTPLRELEDAVEAMFRSRLRPALLTIYRARPHELSCDVVTVRSAIDLLIGACRAVERKGASGAVGQTKGELYAHLDAVARAVMNGERELIEAMATPPASLDAVDAWLRKYLRVVPPPADVLASLDRLLAQVRAAVAVLPTDDARLRPFRMLADCSVTRAGLLAMGRYVAPMLATTVQNPAPLTFKVISGAAPTPLAGLFARYQTDADRPERQPPGPRKIYVNDKLAGNELGNFAAFLSAKWRINDWTWGRADAASRLTEALLERLDHERPGTREELQALLHELGKSPDDPFLDTLWEELSSGAPHTEHRAILRDAVVEHLQLTLWRHHLPLLASATATAMPSWRASSDVLPPDAPGPHLAPRTLEETPDELRQYAVGREGINDIAVNDRCRLAMRLAKVGFAAVLPARPYVASDVQPGSAEHKKLERRGRLVRIGRVALWPLRPLVLIAAYLAAAPVRAMSFIALYVTALAFGWWAIDLDGWDWFTRYAIPAVPAVLLLAAAVVIGSVKRNGWKLGRLLAIASGVLVACFLLADWYDAGWVRWPGWIAVAAVTIMWLGTSWMTLTHRIVATVFTALLYGATVALFRVLSGTTGPWWELDPPFAAGWWALTSLAASAIGFGIHVTHFQVFPNPPGTARAGGVGDVR